MRRALLGLCLIAIALPALAGELSSPSYRHLGGSFDALAATELTASGPRFTSSGSTLGPPGVVGFSGAAADLQTAAAGFWPIVAAAFPSLDVDGDGLPSYADDDDDGDGLLDAVETDTGTFASNDDTGSSPVLFDSDSDGFDDGAEVAAGSDPNAAGSTPAAVPALPAAVAGLLALFLLAAARRTRRLQE